MPLRKKAIVKKRFTKRRFHRKKPFAKTVDKRGQVMINKTPARLHNVIAPHFYTRLQYGFSGTVRGPSGLPTNHFELDLNSIYLPGNTTGSVGANMFTDQAGSALVPATHSLTALMPVGTHAISQMYNDFIVYGSKVSITCTPTTSNDTSLLCVYPFVGIYEPTTVNTNAMTDIQLAMSSPYAKCITVTGNNMIKNNTITMYMDPATLLGQTKTQYKCDPNNVGNPTSGNGADPANKILWGIIYQDYGGTALSNTGLNFEIKVDYWVEFLTPAAFTDTA